MKLIPEKQLSSLPLTAAYFVEHEERLRARERGKMDHDDWRAYVYPKSLGAHDLPKLGVPRLCERLRASADPRGGVYLDNVDVNGILLKDDGPSVWQLAVLLNSQLLDWLFQRGSVPFRGRFMSANKQFIAPLPIRVPEGSEIGDFESLGKKLHRLHADLGSERHEFLDWLAGALQTRVSDISGHSKLQRYDALTHDELLALLQRDRGVRERASARSFRDQLVREHNSSVERTAELQASIAVAESKADELVFDHYGLSKQQRGLVASEYPQPA